MIILINSISLFYNWLERQFKKFHISQNLSFKKSTNEKQKSATLIFKIQKFQNEYL